MTNSDSGTSNQTAAHHPGDRVRVKHNLRHDHHSYSVEQNRARQALAGQIGSIRERAPSGAYRVAPPGPPERGAWFEADELVPIVTDADGLPVGGADAPPADRPVPELRARVTMSDRAAEALAVLVTELGAGYDASQAGEALRSALTTANAEAQGWHEAALLARGKAEEARDELQAVEAEREALRGKLGAAELKLADALEALATERAAHEETGRLADRWRKERDAALGGGAIGTWRAEIEARLGRLETMGTGMGTEPTARARVSGA